MKHCDFKKVASNEEFWKSIHLLYLSAEAKNIWHPILAFIPDSNLVPLFPSLHHKLVLLIIHEQQVRRYVAGHII